MSGWEKAGTPSILHSRAGRLGVKQPALVNTFEELPFGVEQWDLIESTYEPTKAIA